MSDQNQKSSRRQSRELREIATSLAVAVALGVVGNLFAALAESSVLGSGVNSVVTNAMSALARALGSFDPLPFMARYKFEITVVCGVASALAYFLIHRAAAFTASGIGPVALALIAGAGAPAGVVCFLMPFFPNRLNLFSEFRDSFAIAGFVMTVVVAVVVREALSKRP